MTPPSNDLVPPQLRALFDVCTEVGRVTFPQPAALMNMNHRTHWRVRHAATKAWRNSTAFAAVKALGSTPSARLRPACFVAVVFPVPDLRRRDPSNLAPTQKAFVDGLVTAGVWRDDTPEFVTTVEPVLRVFKRTPWEPAPEVVVHLLARPERSP